MTTKTKINPLPITESLKKEEDLFLINPLAWVRKIWHSDERAEP